MMSCQGPRENSFLASFLLDDFGRGSAFFDEAVLNKR
jgi:hypothetical protein